MYYHVYIIQSISFPSETYIGFTTNIKKRLTKHNESGTTYTANFKPWKIKNIITFKEKDKALAFEKYLKSHSGRAFANKHF